MTKIVAHRLGNGSDQLIITCAQACVPKSAGRRIYSGKPTATGGAGDWHASCYLNFVGHVIADTRLAQGRVNGGATIVPLGCILMRQRVERQGHGVFRLADVMGFSESRSDGSAARRGVSAGDRRTFLGNRAEFGRDTEMRTGRALLFDDRQSAGSAIRALVADMGYAISNVSEQIVGLCQAVEAARPDLVVIRATSPSHELLEQLRLLPAEHVCPIVMFSEDGSPTSINAAVEAGVNSYVVVGATGNRVRSAVELAHANFQTTRGLRAERDEALAALRDRKLIERAKGLVMKQRGLDEAGAYELLRKRAMQKGIRLVDVATMINEAAEMLSD